jgi:hypothetical protein
VLGGHTNLQTATSLSGAGLTGQTSGASASGGGHGDILGNDGALLGAHTNVQTASSVGGAGLTSHTSAGSNASVNAGGGHGSILGDEGAALNSHTAAHQGIINDHSQAATTGHVIDTTGSTLGVGTTSHTGTVISTPDSTSHAGIPSSIDTGHTSTVAGHGDIGSTTHVVSEPDHYALDSSSGGAVDSSNHAPLFDTSHESVQTHQEVDTHVATHGDVAPHGF